MTQSSQRKGRAHGGLRTGFFELFGKWQLIRFGALVLSMFLLADCAGLRLERFKGSPEDWTTFGGNPSRTNSSISVVRPPFSTAWTYNALSGISTTLLVRDSVVIVSTLQGELQTVNILNGKRLGYMVLESAVAGTPTLDASVLYVPIASGTETLFALDLNESQRLWTASPGAIETSPLVNDRFVYVTTLKGTLCCLDKKSGAEVWTFRTQGKEDRKPVRSSPSTDGKSIFFGGDDGYIYAVEAQKGELQWKYKTSASIFATPVTISGSVIVGSLDGNLYCLGTANGDLRWVFRTGSKLYGAVSATDRSVFFGSADGICRAVDLQTGNERWRFASKSVIDSAPLIVNDLLYVGSLDKTLYVLNTEDGKEVWRYAAEGRIRVSPVVWRGLLLITSEDKYVTALKPEEPA
ncbi:MAG: PQQ-binding-like beta-propeller repeat protein [Bacteroidota bacterium]